MIAATDTIEVLTGEDPTVVSVGIDDPGHVEGDRELDIPTILMQGGPDGINWSVRMTWAEAKELAAAILEVTAVAENG